MSNGRSVLKFRTLVPGETVTVLHNLTRETVTVRPVKGNTRVVSIQGRNGGAFKRASRVDANQKFAVVQ